MASEIEFDFRNHLLIEMWNVKLFDTLISRRKQENNSLNLPNESGPDEVLTSNIGCLLWHENVKLRSLPDIYSEFEFQNQTLGNGLKGKRQTTRIANTGKVPATQLFEQLSSGKGFSSHDPHSLLAPYKYGESFGPAADDKQPYDVVVHPQVG
jgi:hypothetical protein